MYDKQGSVLRLETTTDNPAEFKRRRRAEGDPDSDRKMRPLRKGVADMRARAKASADANARYLDAPDKSALRFADQQSCREG